MQRVAVIGNIAGGKSTLARAIAASTGLPYHELEVLARRSPRPFDADLQTKLDAEFQHRHAELIGESTWVIDGIGLWETVRDRLLAADTIVHIDHPLWVHFLWATKRIDGSSEPRGGMSTYAELERVFPRIWDYHRRIRPRLLHTLQEIADTKTVHTLRNPAELAVFAAARGGG